MKRIIILTAIIAVVFLATAAQAEKLSVKVDVKDSVELKKKLKVKVSVKNEDSKTARGIPCTNWQMSATGDA